jgi:phosphoserine phosphatase RsbU/P
MTPDRAAWELLPEAVVKVLEEFRQGFRLDAHLWMARSGEEPAHLFPPGGDDTVPLTSSILLEVPARNGSDLLLEVRGRGDEVARTAANALRTALEQLYDYSEEVRFFTYEVSERYEEINLLYFISETLGSLLSLRDASRIILAEVCDVMGARRGSLWVHRPAENRLHLVASVGEGGLQGPLEADHPTAVTAQVFREGRSLILTGDRFGDDPGAGREPAAAREDSVLSVPIRYTPPAGEPRTVGVVNLIGRRRGGRFTASDQKLLAAIASQIGAALENHRLLRESVERERVTREMELAHDLQMKLLPTVDGFQPEVVAARVEPAESVGGDFYHFLRLPGGRFGVMIGDVSSHGFPAALIMALSMSAATIYASAVQSPARVLGEMSRALRDELETTEMYLTLFYAVVNPQAGELVYANAGHPHAFSIRGDGSAERLEAMDPPMGIAADDEHHERTVPWEAGRDLLLLFTDGLSETLVPGSRAAGEERVVAETARLRGEAPKAIVEALFGLDRGDGDEGLDTDDRTALVLKV